MQMGRWFGYRDGYIDACRLYLDRENCSQFQEHCVATQRMRDDFDDMNNRGVKPRDYGLKVMRFPGVLEATARNKFGSAVKGRLSLNKTTLQAYKLSRLLVNHRSQQNSHIEFPRKPWPCPAFRKIWRSVTKGISFGRLPASRSSNFQEPKRQQSRCRLI